LVKDWTLIKTCISIDGLLHEIGNGLHETWLRHGFSIALEEQWSILEFLGSWKTFTYYCLYERFKPNSVEKLNVFIWKAP